MADFAIRDRRIRRQSGRGKPDHAFKSMKIVLATITVLPALFSNPLGAVLAIPVVWAILWIVDGILS